MVAAVVVAAVVVMAAVGFSQLPQMGASENEKNLFFTGTQKIEKCFSIFSR